MGRRGRAVHRKSDGARSGPYGRFYGPWREEWAGARLSGTQYAVMLAMCQWLRFTKDGRAYASRARREVASEAGVTETAVEQAVRRLKALGFLRVKQSGHRGAPTVYWVMPETPWPEKALRANRPIKPIHTDTPNAEKGCLQTSQRGVSTDSPSINRNARPSALQRRADGAGVHSIQERKGEEGPGA